MTTTTHPPAAGLHLDLNTTPTSLPDGEELPPLAALFQLNFDIKAGYTISWSRTIEDVDLDGVEFKSLPSGLHNLSSDLVYFIHGAYAGVSAFIRVVDPTQQRGALMLTVGALVPLSSGRLGRCWRHVSALQSLARTFATDPSTHAPLEQYFTQHRLRRELHASSPLTRRISLRARANSLPGAGTTAAAVLPPSHPARSLLPLLTTFGPLIFPLHRAAVARKRILLTTHAPVQVACNYVYTLSILASIPSPTASLLPVPASALRPLFNVGVHDIPSLEEAAARRRYAAADDAGSWVACTTDEILAMKTALWDVLVRLPTTPGAYPTVSTAAGPVLATQRDLRRWRALAGALGLQERGGVEEGVEGLGWREVVAGGFVWWASAGAVHEEEAEDRVCLFPPSPSPSVEGDEEEDARCSGAEHSEGVRNRKRSRTRSEAKRLSEGSVELEVIAYFQGITGRVLEGVVGAVGGEGELDGEGEEGEGLLGEQEGVVEVEEMVRWGLDRWSEGDREWVREVGRRWAGRNVKVVGGGCGCCGVECF